ncbi:hypothetical protein CDCA_CDCA14G3808 [Cyanidium caldarium]|uniref:PPM-type phosphatase domain-containing protein n=1 Tax=Cyanidium caldarium TaxID=2771 RepID=A0AAV9J185_CYACA|nr:hypothetical protein CDCA_CDCA14G3808 [Cyanidium caldarium]
MDSAAVDDSDASPFVDASTMVSEADSTSVEAAPPLPRSSLESKSTATATATTTTTADSGSSASSSSSSSSSSTHTATVPALSAVQSFGFAEDANLRFRQSNEDGHAFIDRFCGKRDDAFFAIYDGHGGREAVEIIEQRLHQLFAEEWLRATAVAERADDIRPAADAEDRSSKAGFSTADHHHVAPVTPGDGNVHHAQRAFQRAYARMDRELESHHCAYVGSTSITCLLSRDATSGRRYLYTANAGDSRAILVRRDGSVLRLSYDHKASDEREARRIHEQGGFVACRRVLGVLSVTRSFGDFALKHFVVCEPHSSVHAIDEHTDTHVVLACDGLFDVMSDEEVAECILASAEARVDAQLAAEQLVARALHQGSTDNVSCMVVRLT